MVPWFSAKTVIEPKKSGSNSMSTLVPLVTLIIPITFLILFYPPRINKIGPNALIGIRTVATTHDQKSWEIAHKIAWPYILSSNLLLLVVLLLTGYLSTTVEGTGRDLIAGIGTAIGVLVWLIILITGGRIAHKAVWQRLQSQEQ